MRNYDDKIHGISRWQVDRWDGMLNRHYGGQWQGLYDKAGKFTDMIPHDILEHLPQLCILACIGWDALNERPNQIDTQIT